MPAINTLVSNIKKLMAHHKIKGQVDLSSRMEKAGYSYSQANISRLFNGYKNIEIEKLIMFSKFFNVTVGQLLGTEPLVMNKWELSHKDEYKRQIDLIYPNLTLVNRDKLSIYANDLLSGQPKESPDIATPFFHKNTKEEIKS